MQQTSDTIKQLCKEIGFDLCGITKAEIVPESIAHLKNWLSSGYQADMKWMENPKRLSPQEVLPEAKSIIMLALNYYSSKIPEVHSEKIARYARGRDYHKVIEKMLKAIVNNLQEIYPGEKFLYYVDYGPFSERTYAEKAGIGFIGKNGNIITNEFGSYVLLSEIITTVPLEYDTPATRKCGTCTKCLDGCPTKAIIDERMVDSNLCISYQTIENKTENIPQNIKENLSGWAFGCDICQEVCPFNNSIRNKDTDHEDLHPRYTSFQKEHSALENDDAFLQKFAGTPIMRAKRKGIVRNISP